MTSSAAVLNAPHSAVFVHPSETHRQAVPGFDVLEELGRGGMGVVYKARQTALNRTVALKTILSGSQAQEADQLRFLAEVEAVAAVRHPNVVQVFEFGRSSGLAYFAMEFLEGGSLAGLLVEHGKLPAAFVAGVVEPIARGVQATHDVGVVHRDLKPANILFANTECGVRSAEFKNTESSRSWIHHPPSKLHPKVTDFGLAKRGGGYDLTLTGVVMGTPAYMAPEQAQGQGKFVGPSADVYALGVVLYECLTSRPPFYGDDATVVLTRVVLDDPPPLRRYSPEVPRDLELICMKCLEKTPATRYPTAAALADDLARFLRGEPVSVRPAGKLEKAARWVRRYPTRAALYGVTLLASALIGLTAGVVEMWRTAEFNHRQTDAALTYAERAKERAEQLQNHAETEKARAEAEKWNAMQATSDAEVAREEALQKRGEATQARAREADVRAALSIALAHRELEWNNLALARKLLDECPRDRRGWEWHYLDRACEPAGAINVRLNKLQPVTSCNALTISNDGSRVVVAGSRTPIQVFDAHTGNSLWSATGDPLLDVRIAEDGKVVQGFTQQGSLREWELRNGDKIAAMTRKPGPYPARIASNGALGITWDPSTGVVTLFNPATGAHLQTTGAHPGPTAIPVISPLGKRVLTAGSDQIARLWDAETGQQLQVLAADAGPISAMAMSPDGSRIVTAGQEGWLKLWDTATGRAMLTLRVPGVALRAIGWSTNGSHLIALDSAGIAHIYSATPLTR